MKQRLSLVVLLLAACVGLSAENLPVTSCRYAGPYVLERPVMIDSLNLSGTAFADEEWLKMPLNLSAVAEGKTLNVEKLPGCSSAPALHLLGFSVENEVYTTATFEVKGPKHFKVYVDGVERAGGSATLEPARHEVVVKYLSKPEDDDSLRITVQSERDGLVHVADGLEGRLYTMEDVVLGRRYSSVSVSPDGRFALVSESMTRRGGSTTSRTKLWDLQSRRVLNHSVQGRWMPRSSRYYFTRTASDQSRTLLAVDPRTNEEVVLAEHLPDGAITMSPTEDFCLLAQQQEGPKEKKEIFEVVEPDDRQPGWRDRVRLLKFDFATGLCRLITFGKHQVDVSNISSDGRYALIYKSESRLLQRPTTVFSYYRIDLTTMAVDTLVVKDGFVNGALFSPDGRSVLFTGSPEAFGGIGNVVPAGRVPSMVDVQLFLMDLGQGQQTSGNGQLTTGNDVQQTALYPIKPMTKTFNPCVQSVDWCNGDGQIYFTAEDKDCLHLFRLNPKSGHIARIDVPEDLVNGFSLSESGAKLVYYGQGASNSDRLYAVENASKRVKVDLLEDLSAERLQGVVLGDCKAWSYLNNRGDTICCRYYLPPRFDASKQYPMIVNYYGGCSPTSRNFESRYPQHAYAAQGYVVLIVNPSGATGFGQEFSSRHVNTAGEGVAEDIIGAVKTFCAEHAWVNSKKIGCIGASYGGFMTQYLQTKTDIFAAAVSHAGISDHTSYWGEGYWGYSYSEVSMANSYPWTDKHLYVDQSPLFNADKIHTPLLFVHGTGDTNVPVGESIQMFTALKLLGRPTAMVLVDGQNHWITDNDKRMQWQNTIFAWFARYLKDDAAWWESMYKGEKIFEE